MEKTTAIAIYFLIWWVVLFAVLPWGVRSQEEAGEVVPGTDPGAPAAPKVWKQTGLDHRDRRPWCLGFSTAIYQLGLIPVDFLMRISGAARA